MMLLLALIAVASPQVPRPTWPSIPAIAYSVRLTPEHPELVEVTIRLDHAPATVQLAMKIHPEYNGNYWRAIDTVRVEGSADDGRAGVVRQDSTLWRVSLPGGHGVIRYRLRVEPQPPDQREAWQTAVRTDGAMLNSPDIFLYLPEFAAAPVTVDLDVPPSWRIATALASTGTLRRLTAPDAAALLDAPILMGALRWWSFTEGGIAFHLVYWPLPDAVPFDTLAFADGIRRITHEAMAVFGRGPGPRYSFLVVDGATDALEHGGSVTIGVPSRWLAPDPHASMGQLAHEFFHTWNLVAIHPAGFNRLSHGAARRTTGLWFGEGVTLYYADLLRRRAGLAAQAPTRLERLATMLERYYGSPAIQRVSPERASLAYEDPWSLNHDGTGGYYLQGELLGNLLEARLRTATGDRIGLDAVMRTLLRQSRTPGDGGYTSQSLERTFEAACRCHLDQLFETEVRGPGPIDPAPLLGRLGLRMIVDSAPAEDSAGHPLPDFRLGAKLAEGPGVLRLALSNPGTLWARAGLETGDALVSVGDSAITSFDQLQRVLHRLQVGDSTVVQVRRGEQPTRVAVVIAGYRRPRVRFVDAPDLTAEQRRRRAAWLVGR